MTKLKLGIITALVVAGVATPLLIQHHAQASLREENHSLRQQQEQLAQQLGPLAAENLRLSNLLAKANASSSVQDDRSGELLKLRGEVARLRQGLRDSTQAKATTSGTADDPDMEASLKTWATRVTQLKQRLEQMLDRKIPELQLVPDNE